MRWLVVLLVSCCVTGETRPVILAFGDSITDGYGVAKGQTYPDYLQRSLDARGHKWRVVNAGVSGDTTGNALDRLPSVLAMKPQLVILEFGGNDGLRGLPLDATRKNLEEIIRRLQGAGVRVLLVGMTLPGNYGPEFVGQFENMYEALARQYKLVLIPVKAAGVAGVPGLMQRDGIHPTGEGYRKLAAFLLPRVEAEIRRFREPASK